LKFSPLQLNDVICRNAKTTTAARILIIISLKLLVELLVL